MLYDNRRPRYLPHLDHPEVLQMGLQPLRTAPWIETDTSIADYHAHKLDQRATRGDAVFRATEGSLPAQRELHDALLRYLTESQPPHYQLSGQAVHCVPGGFAVELATAEPLWNCSLWVADDLVLMERVDGSYRLTAASLCSPSHWHLREKFNRSMRHIHDPIPGFHRELTPRIDRFFDYLKPEHPVVRFNWAIQADDALAQLPDAEPAVTGSTPLYYRSERQSLLRLPRTGAIAFTIRVYLHPLDSLRDHPGALSALQAAVAATPPALARYKGFDRLAPALANYRE